MSLQSTDPEYTQRLGAFFEEVRNEPDSMLEPTTRWLAILATPHRQRQCRRLQRGTAPSTARGA